VGVGWGVGGTIERFKSDNSRRSRYAACGMRSKAMVKAVCAVQYEVFHITLLLAHLSSSGGCRGTSRLRGPSVSAFPVARRKRRRQEATNKEGEKGARLTALDNLSHLSLSNGNSHT